MRLNNLATPIVAVDQAEPARGLEAEDPMESCEIISSVNLEHCARNGTASVILVLSKEEAEFKCTRDP